MAIKINTQNVVTAANTIDGKNNNIRSAFSSVESAISQLDRNWEGSASDRAMNNFRAIQRSYCDNRYNVISNLTNFMRRQVGEGYSETEQSVSTAAALFK